MGKKSKKQDNYWDSEAFEEDTGAEPSSPVKDTDEDMDSKAGNKNQKKTAKPSKQDNVDEDGLGVKQNGDMKGKNKKQQKTEEKETTKKNANVDEEKATTKTSNNKQKGNKRRDEDTDTYSEDAAAEVESSENSKKPSKTDLKTQPKVDDKKKAQKGGKQADDEEDEQKEQPKGGKGKGGKGKGKKDDYWDSGAFEEDVNAAEEIPSPQKEEKGDKGKKAAEEVAPQPKSPAAKKVEDKKGGKAGNKKTDVTSPPPKSPEPEVVEEEPKGDKGKKKGAATPSPAKSPAPPLQKEDEGTPTGGKGGKKKGKKKDDYWETEAFEQDLEAPEEPKSPEPQKAGKGKLKKGGEVPDKGAMKEDGKQQEQKLPSKEEEVAKDEQAEPISPGQPLPEKGKEKKGEGKKAKPLSAAEKRRKQLAELIKKQQEEEEQRRKVEEERRKLQEEEERRRAEEEAKLEEERRRKKEEKKAKKKEKYVPPTEKARMQKDAAFRAVLEAQGLIPKKESEEVVEAAEQQPKKKVVYGDKRKKKPKKGEEGEEEVKPAAEAPPSATPATPSELQAPPAPAPPATVEEKTAAYENWEEAVEEAEDWESKDWESAEIVLDKEKERKEKEEKERKMKEEQERLEREKKAKEEAERKERERKEKEEKEAREKEEKDNAKKKPGKKGAKGAKGKEEKAEAEEKEPQPVEKELRSPICCVLGHVDTGKTSLLDRIRQTNVQAGEAGGITQQIGATYFPMDTLQDKTKTLSEKFQLAIKVPGLLVIDTPGHESFTNLRSRGSGLCDIAILVVDIMHGLEPQTIESINLLRMRKTPFVVALNKVDRIYDWKPIQNSPFRESMKLQDKQVVMEFDRLVKETITAFAEQGLNAVLYYRNTDFRKYVSLVPTSAVSGEGIADLLMLLVQLTQKMMPERLYFSPTVQATVLEVKVIEGLGTTVDVILVNGVLREGDIIVLCGLNGPIATTIRALLTPQPLKELRVKGQYVHHKEIKAAMGVKVVAQDLEKAVAGSALLVAQNEDEIPRLKKEVQSDLDTILTSVDSSARGVCVQASTLGSLEALLTFLKASKVPVSGVSIGPIHKKDVIRASVMLEHNKEYAVILAFDVKVEKDAVELADQLGVRIFTADIIYHLFTQFTDYMKTLKEQKRQDTGAQAVWPAILKIKPDCVFNKKDPIVLGVEVVDGVLKLGTPICVPSREFTDLGVIASIERNHKAQEQAKKGEEVAIKIEAPPDQSKVYGRHFDHTCELVSKISRESIDTLKELWGEELTQQDRQLILKLKGVFKIS
jgi:translation initiation factor 5B